ncbi:Hypothetical predicted protein [Mytilus galloprovincialis]|uniref:Uncharacterized protein n=1 Tax=Mytilus galloprovincialis TaxID=29158 RepID=A0A8B6H9S1_MYTGA|nr:Hypothetical predicted protein [Mytilus galloprovincialis]
MADEMVVDWSETEVMVTDQSTTISSAISNYLPLDKPSSSSSVPPSCITSAYPNVYSTMSTVPTDTARTRPETPMSTTGMSSPDQDPYSPDISPTVQYIFDQEYILPQILGSEEPQISTPKPQPVQTLPASLAQPPTHNLNQQILTALFTFTITQELLLKEMTHNTKAIQTLSSDIAYLRGQFRQFEREQGRHQTIQDRLSNLSNRPFKQIRRKPYLNRPKVQQRQPTVKSVASTTSGFLKGWNIRYCPELHAQKKRNSTLIPNKPMSPEASPITEITVNEHQLFYNKERDMHKIQFQALNDFIIFLSSLSEKLSGLTVIFFTPVSIPIVE